MKNFSPFQIGVFVLCGAGILFSVLIFSGKISVGQKSIQKVAGSITVWGTLPRDAVDPMIEVFNKTYKEVSVTYSEKDPAVFQSEFVEALASGNGPDLITITPSNIIQNKNKLFVVPYASLPEATFRTTFIDTGSVYLADTGVLAFPLIIDPMIMYYNKDLLSSAFSVRPPENWDELVALNKVITKKDDAGRLMTETVALGTFDNITNAKDLIALMILQAGNKIVDFDRATKKYISVFGQSSGNGVSPVAQAIKFYTSFANVADNDHYSWAPTLPKDKTQFIAGNLATYLGYASELVEIRQKNPNLNFDITLMPQRASSPVKMTYGNITGIAVVKASKNPTLALLVAQQFASKDAIMAYLNYDPTAVPARKDLLEQGAIQDDARKSLLYKSAIIARSWVDPDARQTTDLFKKFIDQINAGLAVPEAIISPGESLLSSILQKTQVSPSTESL